MVDNLSVTGTKRPITALYVEDPERRIGLLGRPV